MEKIMPLHARLIGCGFILADAAFGAYNFTLLCRFFGFVVVTAAIAALIAFGLYFLFHGRLPNGPHYLKRFGIYLQEVANRAGDDEKE